MQTPNVSAEIFNVIANFATVCGIVVALYVLTQVRRISQRLELVIAPKGGIEGYLNMCERVVECDPDGTCVVADNGMIVLVNKSMEDISGYHRSELVGQSIEILVPEMHRGQHPQHRESFITTPSPRPMRGLTMRHKRGRELPVGINLNHYMDTSGGFTIAKVRPSNSDWRSTSSIELPRTSE